MTAQEHRARVLALVIDAADAPLIWEWSAAGHLPVLDRLRREGATARLASPSEWMPEAGWPTINTGCRPGGHGISNWRMIEPGTHVRRRTPGAAWKQPFWQLLRRSDVDARVILFDIPFTTPLGDPGVTEVIGWGERGAVRRASWPPDLFERIVERHGAYPDWVAEDYVRWPLEEARLVATFKRMIGRRTDALEELLEDGAWDLCLASYSEPHNAGHALYRHLKPGTWPHQPRRARRHADRLLEVYRALDAAIGRLIVALPGATDVVVVSGKGFRINTSGETALPKLLTALGYHVPASTSARARGVKAARALVRAAAPRPLRRRVMGSLPWQERDRLLEALWTESTDWARTRAFAEVDPGHACVRLNVRGREPLGVVKPGREYEALCQEIAEELRKVTHARTGAPAVAAVVAREELTPGAHVDKLPDLFIKWNWNQLLDEIHHPRVGVIRERINELQTAEHTGDAFLIGWGPSFQASVDIGHGDLADVAPTLMHLLGAPIPTDMDGDVLEALLSPTGVARGPVRREPIEWEQDPWALTRRSADHGLQHAAAAVR